MTENTGEFELGSYTELRVSEQVYRITSFLHTMTPWEERWLGLLNQQAYLLSTGKCATEAEFINQLDDAIGWGVVLQDEEPASVEKGEAWGIYISIDSLTVLMEQFIRLEDAEQAIEKLLQCTDLKLEIRRVEQSTP